MRYYSTVAHTLPLGDPGQMGSVEQAYWHFGYLTALRDLRAAIMRRRQQAN
jgi:hypothetical protein